MSSGDREKVLWEQMGYSIPKAYLRPLRMDFFRENNLWASLLTILAKTPVLDL